MDEQADRRLVLFDFDGTLAHLATDYDTLRRELHDLADEAGVSSEGGFVELIARLEAAVGPRAGTLVDEAERAGLAAGGSRQDMLERYRAYAQEGARLAIVSHNGRAVIEQFVTEHELPAPDAIIDRTELAGFKEESPRVAEYVRAVQPETVIVVGDSAHDERLARRLGAEFLAVEQ